jgi:hypothetical protein
MSVTTIQVDPRGAQQVAPATAGRRILRLFALLAGAAAVFAITVGVRSLASADRNTAGSVSTVGLAMPRSAEIEHVWGVQIKSVTLLASTGVIDVRYTVIDDGKATRLHTDGRTGLPSLRTTDHGTVKPDSVMFHFHSKAEEVAGQGYDIIYGNAHGAVHVGSIVTVVMSDGLELANVPVKE